MNIEFSNYWKENQFDYVLALEIVLKWCAVQAGIPFEYYLCIYTGETNLGAIDNIYRHQISLASKIHLV